MLARVCCGCQRHGGHAGRPEGCGSMGRIGYVYVMGLVHAVLLGAKKSEGQEQLSVVWVTVRERVQEHQGGVDGQVRAYAYSEEQGGLVQVRERVHEQLSVVWVGQYEAYACFPCQASKP